MVFQKGEEVFLEDKKRGGERRVADNKGKMAIKGRKKAVLIELYNLIRCWNVSLWMEFAEGTAGSRSFVARD